jgi:transcriptional regulator with XRE-family HTH domain
VQDEIVGTTGGPNFQLVDYPPYCDGLGFSAYQRYKITGGAKTKFLGLVMVFRKPASALDWSRRILAFRKALGLTQAGLAKQLNTSAMAVSRWERGEAEPPAKSYIQLGHLAGDPLCWFFWERAGLSSSDLMRILPTARRRMRQGGIANVQIVHAGAKRVKSVKPTDFVAIPVLPVRAATSGEDAEEVADLDLLKPEAIWAAPAEWCPNPIETISLRVKGNSMSPLILDGYIIAVDTSDASRDELLGQIVVVRNTADKRLLVSRLIRFDHTDALVSDQRAYQPVLLAPESTWRIVGRVLWWAGRSDSASRGLSATT